MRLHEGEIVTIFPTNNYVVLKPLIDTNQTQTSSGITFTVDTTYKPEHHARVLCEVVSLPKQLIFTKKYPYYSMEWECEMMLRIGDKVMIKYLAALNAEKYWYMMDGDQKYYMVPYQQVYLRIRDEVTTMLNGYVLVQRIKQNKKSKIQLLPKDEDRLGVVKYCHKPNYQYLDANYDDDIINVGDKIVLSYHSSHYKVLENPVHRVFDPDNEYLVMQRHQIEGVLKE